MFVAFDFLSIVDSSRRLPPRWIAPTDVIEISSAVARRGQRAIREVVCHEAAHVVVWDRYGRCAPPPARNGRR